MQTSPSGTRPAAVAGSFYPGNPTQLVHDIAGYLATTPATAVSLVPTLKQLPKAIIVPHAGYIYSAAVAAKAYALLTPFKGIIERVVLIGPCHRVALEGIGVPSAEAFATPLGNIPLDLATLQRLQALPSVVYSDAAHAQEHSLEVQLPFLQSVLGKFLLVPLAVGNVSANVVAQVIDHLWGGPETVFVISSDLSHFHPYAEAQSIDQATVQRIAHLEQLTSFDQACGALPINGMLHVAKQRGLSIETLAVCNSGDTAGDKSRVVGYASFALYQDIDTLLGSTLLTLARNAISTHFGQNTAPELSLPELSQPGAAFVTLTLNGQLRGCIGSLEAHRPLQADVRTNALAAALRDPRFPPLTAQEATLVRVEVSLLTPPQALSVKDESDALAQLRPHIDGVIFTAGGTGGGGARSTFLPQVWEQLPEPRQFMAHLKQKAGLNAAYWAPDVKLYRYQVKKWKETIP